MFIFRPGHLLHLQPIIGTDSDNKTWIARVEEDKLLAAHFTFNEEGNPIGFGIRGNFWGGVAERQEGQSVKERAEVWFHRVV